MQTINLKVLEELKLYLQNENFEGSVLFNEPGAKHTSFKIGGPCQILTANNISDLKMILSFVRKFDIDWKIIGKGSNLLISDAGFDGLIIKLGSCFSDISFDKESGLIYAGAACSFARLINFAYKNKIWGYQFGVGTPGSLGGAVKMNAGTKTDWIGSKVKCLEIVDPNGEIYKLQHDDVVWQYRKTSIKDLQIVTKCILDASRVVSDKDQILLKNISEDIMNKRHKNQPLNWPSCGSTFKNPVNKSAGELIEHAGLKGCQVGGAQVSTKHANFIVNLGNASAADVVNLIHRIQRKVFDSFSVKLIPEVKFIGFSGDCSLF